MKNNLQFTHEEMELLKKVKEIHKTNGTPNHRKDERSILSIAIAGVKKFPGHILKTKE